MVDLDNSLVYIVSDGAVTNTFPLALGPWLQADVEVSVSIGTVIGFNNESFLFFWITDAEGKIDFGQRGNIRTGLEIANGQVVHHLIPVEWQKHEIVQAAAQYKPEGGLPFHLNNGTLNGLPMSPLQHTGGGFCSHTAYNTKILVQLDIIAENLVLEDGVIIEEKAYYKLMDLISRIRARIIGNPSILINDIDYNP